MKINPRSIPWQLGWRAGFAGDKVTSMPYKLPHTVNQEECLNWLSGFYLGSMDAEILALEKGNK